MSSYPVTSRLPQVDTPAMVEVDRLMMEDYQINLFQMMENAGRCLARLTRDVALNGSAKDKRVVVLAGSGGNGGGALTAARRLASWGAEVTVGLAQDKDKMSPVPLHQLQILEKMERITVGRPEDAGEPDAVLDGLVGYSLSGAPFGRVAELIEWVNACPAPTLSLDVPSGFDATGARVLAPAVRAAATLTIALPKAGLQDTLTAEIRGALYCCDISVPPELYLQLPEPLEVEAIFTQDDIVQVDVGIL